MQPPSQTSPQPDIPPSDFNDELDALAQALEKALAQDDLGIFYQEFRRSHMLLLPFDLRDEPHTLFERTSKLIWRLGSLSPAVALAVENHYSVLCPIATLDTAHDEGLDARRLKLLDELRANRCLVANTNSRVHGGKVTGFGTVAKRHGEQYEVSGEAVYLSLAREGDRIFLVTFFETGQPVIFACPLKDNPEIEIGPFLFPDAMQDSDTRRVSFHALKLDDSHLLVSGLEHPDILSIITFQQLWHHALLAALSLGTAARALEEGRLFLRSAKRPDGVLLAELDGMVVDMGRQVLRYHVARGSVDQAGRALGSVAAAQPFDPGALDEAYEAACAAKYCTTGFAEDVVGVVRRIIGARTFAGNHGMERLSKEVVFGPLGGEVNALVERRFGKGVLSESSLLSPTPR